MPVEEFLRLAWHADRDGRWGMRDALLTLAAAGCADHDPVLADRCRRRLLAHRPDHLFASFATLGQALAHPTVVGSLAQLRATYPPGRVGWLLLRAEVRRGAYRRTRRSLVSVCDDLLGVRRATARRRQALAPASQARPRVRNRPLEAAPLPAQAGALVPFYLLTLAALGLLIRPSAPAGANDSRAA